MRSKSPETSRGQMRADSTPTAFATRISHMSHLTLLHRNITGGPPSTRRRLGIASQNRRKWCALNRSIAHFGAPEVRVRALTNKGAHYCSVSVRTDRCAIRPLTSISSTETRTKCRKRRRDPVARPRGVRKLAPTAHIAEYHDVRTVHENVRAAHQNAQI